MKKSFEYRRHLKVFFPLIHFILNIKKKLAKLFDFGTQGWASDWISTNFFFYGIKRHPFYFKPYTNSKSQWITENKDNYGEKWSKNWSQSHTKIALYFDAKWYNFLFHIYFHFFFCCFCCCRHFWFSKLLFKKAKETEQRKKNNVNSIVALVKLRRMRKINETYKILLKRPEYLKSYEIIHINFFFIIFLLYFFLLIYNAKFSKNLISS